MLSVDTLDIARWQFGITTVYHFIMVPLTIGLSLMVAGMQTAWVRTGKQKYYAMTKFWGKLMLINFAMGVVTGIVQEFQFGMNWSDYSRFVGDVFGAPLAMEGIVAFFVESTFLGLWIFGWDRLSKRAHLACIWAASLASTLSAMFILSANSWMQHPVGATIVNGKATLHSIWAVFTNNTAIAAISHTLSGSFAVAGTFLVGIAAWHLARKHRDKSKDAFDGDTDAKAADRSVWHTSLRLGAWVGLIAFAALAITGDFQGKLMFKQQPMKMAAAEALCHTEQPASFSIFALGNVSDTRNCEEVKSFTIPALLSFLAEDNFTAKVSGVDDLIKKYEAKYGTNYPNDPRLGKYAGQPIDYVPNLATTYWSFRGMIGFGAISALACLAALWLTRKGRLPQGNWFHRAALFSIATPFIGNIYGWLFTEMGRQPFVVVPNPTGVDGVWMYTVQAISKGVTAGEMLASVITLTALYGMLAFVEFFLLRRYVRGGIDGVIPGYGKKKSDTPEPVDHDDVLAFAY
jgi:cytochrome d ubiquinol oxidase subunit I